MGNQIEDNVHIAPAGKAINLNKLPTEGRLYFEDREESEDLFRELRRELVELQRRFYAEGRSKLLIVLQAMDAGGKDGL